MFLIISSVFKLNDLKASGCLLIAFLSCVLILAFCAIYFDIRNVNCLALGKKSEAFNEHLPIRKNSDMMEA